MKRQSCLLTHGGAGYTIGDSLTVYRYENEPDINVRAEFKCVLCGYKGKAWPTRYRTHYYSPRESLIKYFKNEIKFREPEWPNFLSRRFVYIKRGEGRKKVNKQRIRTYGDYLAEWKNREIND